MINIILIIFSLLGIIYILYPIFFNKTEQYMVSVFGDEQKILSLNEHKKTLFSALKDLEYEYETGKLSQEDYAKIREEYKTKVIFIYKEIDEITSRSKSDAITLTPDSNPPQAGNS